MIFIRRLNTDPYFNIAAEEYVLRNIQDDVVMLWSSLPSIVVGKHQNTFNEINYPFILKNNIPVIRRISGGGTVYHDEGNINYSVITSEERKERFIDFHKFTAPIIQFLSGLGIEAQFEGKNNLTIQGKKFSGNSAHVFKNRVMHHGTILFNSKLDIINEAIHPGKLQIEDKAVQSVRASVGNISEFLAKQFDHSLFKVKLEKYLIKYHNISDIYEFINEDNSAILELVDSKYKTWEWNYGYSPGFSLTNILDDLTISLKVKNGKIEKLDINNINDDNVRFDITRLIGINYRKEALHEKMIQLGLEYSSINKYLELLGF